MGRGAFDELQHRQIVVAGEKLASDQKLPKHDAQREDIAATVELLSADLLGRKIDWACP